MSIQAINKFIARKKAFEKVKGYSGSYALEVLGKLCSGTLIYIVLAGVAVTFLIPLLYMATRAFMSVENSLDISIKWIPTELTLSKIKTSFETINFPLSVRNTLVVAFSSTLFQIISSALAAYGLARIRFKGREAIFFLVLFAFVVPPQVIIVPLYALYKNLGWTESWLPLIAPAIFGHGLRGPLFVILFRQFFKNLPYELEDAARIDGAGDFGTFWRIIFPLAKPAVVVASLFSVVWRWNEFFEPLMYLTSEKLYTVSIMYANFRTSLLKLGAIDSWVNADEPLLMAGCLLVVLPPLLLYVLTSGQFVGGIERTGLVE